MPTVSYGNQHVAPQIPGIGAKSPQFYHRTVIKLGKASLGAICINPCSSRVTQSCPNVPASANVLGISYPSRITKGVFHAVGGGVWLRGSPASAVLSGWRDSDNLSPECFRFCSSACWSDNINQHCGNSAFRNEHCNQNEETLMSIAKIKESKSSKIAFTGKKYFYL